MCLEFDYLTDQLQVANDYADQSLVSVSCDENTTTTVDNSRTISTSGEPQFNDANDNDNHNETNLTAKDILAENTTTMISTTIDDSLFDHATSTTNPHNNTTSITENNTSSNDHLQQQQQRIHKHQHANSTTTVLVDDLESPVIIQHPKRRLLKKESFLNVPYSSHEPVFETPETEIAPIRGFHIQTKKRSSSDPPPPPPVNMDNIDTSRLNRFSLQNRENSTNLLDIAEEDEEEPEMTVIEECHDKENEATLQKPVLGTGSTFAQKKNKKRLVLSNINTNFDHIHNTSTNSISINNKQKKNHRHKRRNSLPETPVFNYSNVCFQNQRCDDSFDTPVDKVDHDWYNSHHQHPHHNLHEQFLRNDSLASSLDNASILRHFVSHDTGLNLNKGMGLQNFNFRDALSHGKLAGRANVGNRQVSTSTVLDEYSPLTGAVATSLGKVPTHSLITEENEEVNEEQFGEELREVHSDSETVVLTEKFAHTTLGNFNEEDDADNEEDDYEDYGSEEVKPFTLDEPFMLKRSLSHNSIFSKYSTNEAYNEISIDNHNSMLNTNTPDTNDKLKLQPPSFTSSTDIKAQTMRWISPNQPTVSSSSVSIFDPPSSSAVGTTGQVVVTPDSIQFKPVPLNAGGTGVGINSKEILSSVVSNNPLLSHLKAQRTSVGSNHSGGSSISHSHSNSQSSAFSRISASGPSSSASCHHHTKNSASMSRAHLQAQAKLKGQTVHPHSTHRKNASWLSSSVFQNYGMGMTSVSGQQQQQQSDHNNSMESLDKIIMGVASGSTKTVNGGRRTNSTVSIATNSTTTDASLMDHPSNRFSASHRGSDLTKKQVG
ncbi:unnamed protein product [Ambrosiozyma monospora]|uniref:Unnamed protein product n=1 Tax=Ambrosiozyma monospora TaxID=43982 RepID=A0ACB5T6F5_AMBMO|nr:unnamed protein product [Ambrosiozyma monospora]